MAKVMVVDDEPDMLENLTEWLTSSGYATLAAADGSEAISLAKQAGVSVVITDLRMPNIDGHDLAALLKHLDPSIEVIFLTGRGTIEDAILALREGRVSDFIQKPLKDLRQLNLVIEKALLRHHLATAAKTVGAARGTVTPDRPAIEVLNGREREILGLLIAGCDNRTIADRVALSEKTVRNQLSIVYEKLGVANRIQAALRARELGMG